MMTDRPQSSGFIKAKKSLGQNFCRDQRIPDEIIRLLAPAPGHQVWEIGPGKGALTSQLVPSGAALQLFEIDGRLKPVLEELFPSVPIIWGDFLELPDSELPALNGSLLVCGNLPYYCGTPIIKRFLENGPRAERIVFLLQDEVAKKAAAPCNTPDYGYLSVHTAFFAKASCGATFGPGSFVPPPKVNSTVLLIEPLTLAEDERSKRLEALKSVSVLFQQRRKQALPLLKRHRPEIDWNARFSELGIPEKARPENISPGQFLKLFS